MGPTPLIFYDFIECVTRNVYKGTDILDHDIGLQVQCTTQRHQGLLGPQVQDTLALVYVI
jgi:hypothetical protein